MVHIRKENVILNMNVNLVYINLDAQQQEDPKFKNNSTKISIFQNKLRNSLCHLNLDLDM